MTSQDTTQAGGWVDEAMFLADKLQHSAADYFSTEIIDEKLGDAWRADLEALRAHLNEQSAAAERMREALTKIVDLNTSSRTDASVCRLSYHYAQAALSAYNQLKKG